MQRSNHTFKGQHMNDDPEKVIYVDTPRVVAWIVTVIAILIIGGIILLMW